MALAKKTPAKKMAAAKKAVAIKKAKGTTVNPAGKKVPGVGPVGKKVPGNGVPGWTKGLQARKRAAVADMKRRRGAGS